MAKFCDSAKRPKTKSKKHRLQYIRKDIPLKKEVYELLRHDRHINLAMHIIKQTEERRR